MALSTMPKTAVYLTPELYEALDHVARTHPTVRNGSVSDVLRGALLRSARVNAGKPVGRRLVGIRNRKVNVHLPAELKALLGRLADYADMSTSEFTARSASDYLDALDEVHV